MEMSSYASNYVVAGQICGIWILPINTDFCAELLVKTLNVPNNTLRRAG